MSRSVGILIFLCVAILLAGGLGVYVLYRPGGDDASWDDDPAHKPAAANTARWAVPASQPCPWWENEKEPTLTGPIDRPFKVEKAYVDKNKRLIRPDDCDGDGLLDAFEMREFGTLRYNAQNWVAAKAEKDRLKLRNRLGSKGALNDADYDGLADDSERKVFGDLQHHPNEDEDGDGFTNHEEMFRYPGLDPLRPNAVDMSKRPYVQWPIPGGTSVHKVCIVPSRFWKAQEKLHATHKIPANQYKVLPSVKPSPATQPKHVVKDEKLSSKS